jgi:hypothetical protein
MAQLRSVDSVGVRGLRARRCWKMFTFADYPLFLLFLGGDSCSIMSVVPSHVQKFVEKVSWFWV